MKKYAWTMAELLIALTIIIILGSFCVGAFKPDTQKSRYFIYSTISNLLRANSSIMEKYGTVMGGDNNGSGNENTFKVSSNVYDWYCGQITEIFTTKSSVNCLRSANATTAANVTLANGIEIYGLASKWQQPYSGSSFYYKNILVDIDGKANGVNKLGVDQFPLRIIGGPGRGAEGLVMPVNCKADKVFSTSLVDVAAAAKNPSCPASNGKDHTADKQIITYDVYKPINTDENAKAVLIASMVSPIQADCMAYGGADGYFSVKECDDARIRIHASCMTQGNCATCTTNMCPEGYTTPATCKTRATAINPNDISCVTLIHKPSGGVSAIIQSMIGDIDNGY